MKNDSKQFRGIPIVKSGSKYQTAAGFTAVKDGIKMRRDAPEPAVGGKPRWLRAQMPAGARFSAVRQTVRDHRLSTVCEEAMCPNIGECWNHGTATIMVMGSVCTRACRFCAVDTGNPKGWLDEDEPENTARAVKLMNLGYIVLTSVDRFARGNPIHRPARLCRRGFPECVRSFGWGARRHELHVRRA